MSNPFREKLNKGQVCAGVLTSMPSTNMAQMLSNSGFDWLFIDMEHGAIDIASSTKSVFRKKTRRLVK